MIKKIIALYFIFFILASCFAEEKDKFVDSDLEADLTYIFTEMATQASSIDGTYFYTSRNKRDAIIQKATIETIDKELKILDDAGRKTIQYLAYAWCDYAALKGNEQDKNARIKTYLKAKENKIELVYQDIKNKGLNVDNINLHVTMYVYIINTVSVTVSGSSNVIAVSSHTGGAYIDRTLTKADLNTTCRNQIRDAISAEAKKQSSRNMLASPNQSLIWRAKLLKEKLLDCPTVPALSGDQSKDLVEMLKYVKSKVANNQKVLLHKTPETPAELIAENVKLANTTYTKLRFRNNSTVNPSFSDPLTYTAEVYDKSAAFIFYDKDKPSNQLFTIALFDENNKEKKDSLEKWIFDGKNKKLITEEALKKVFPSLNNERRKEVVKFFNQYASNYKINTPIKISHFFGQIGAETSLSNLSEDSYSKSGMLTSDLTRTCRKSGNDYVLKYCDLFENYNSLSTNGCPFPFCNSNIVIPTDKTYVSGLTTYAKADYIATLGLEAKDEYFNEKPNDLDFFDYVYACRLGNGTINSKDGSRFRGRGYIQMTGYDNYDGFQKKWNFLNGTSKPMDFMCKTTTCDANLDKIADDTEIAMLSAMVFWDKTNVNSVVSDTTNANIEAVSLKVNGGVHGLKQRIKITKYIYKQILDE